MTRILFPNKRDERLEALRDVALFRPCSPAELQRIAGLTTELVVEQHRVLCRTGSIGKEAFIVVEGYAEVRQNGRCIATIGPSGFFGEMALLDHEPRMADVVAVTPMRVLVLHASDLSDALRGSPTLAIKMLEGLGGRLRRAQTEPGTD